MHVASNSCLIIMYSYFIAHCFLLQIILENCCINDKGNDYLMSVDGMDLQILNTAEHFIPTSSRRVDCAMRSCSAYQLAPLFMNVDCGPISPSSGIHRRPISLQMRDSYLTMDMLESIPSAASILLALQIWKRLNTCSSMFGTDRSPSTITSSSGIVWLKSFSMRSHDMETAYSVLLYLSSL